MNQAKYDKLTPEEKKAVDAISGETAARIFGRGWDKVDTRALALMQANGVVVTKADAKFVADVKAKTAPLEQAWIKSRSQGHEESGQSAGRIPRGNRQAREVKSATYSADRAAPTDGGRRLFSV